MLKFAIGWALTDCGSGQLQVGQCATRQLARRRRGVLGAAPVGDDSDETTAVDGSCAAEQLAAGPLDALTGDALLRQPHRHLARISTVDAADDWVEVPEV